MHYGLFYKVLAGGKKYILAGVLAVALPALISVHSCYYEDVEYDANDTTPILVLHLDDVDAKKGEHILIDVLLEEIEKSVEPSDSGTIIFLPENTFMFNVNIDNIDGKKEMASLRNYINKNPSNNIVLGAEMHNMVESDEGVAVEEKLNTCVSISKDGYAVHSKEIFVPFDENIPPLFVPIFGDEKNYAIKRTKRVFELPTAKVGVGICYETLYGDFMASKLSNSDFMVIIVSERGLHFNEEALFQYISVAKTRAIETNRYIAKSTNSGYAAIIDPKGRVLK